MRAYVATGIVLLALGAWLGICLWMERRAKQAHIAARAASEAPASQLRHLRLVSGRTCFKCRKEPADNDSGMWCTACTPPCLRCDVFPQVNGRPWCDDCGLLVDELDKEFMRGMDK